MKCSECKSTLFTIDIIPCCDDCNQNSAYDSEDEEYTFDLMLIDSRGLIRDHVQEEGECNFGSAFGAGCYMFRCINCDYKTNLPVMEGYQ